MIGIKEKIKNFRIEKPRPQKTSDEISLQKCQDEFNNWIQSEGVRIMACKLASCLCNYGINIFQNRYSCLKISEKATVLYSKRVTMELFFHSLDMREGEPKSFIVFLACSVDSIDDDIIHYSDFSILGYRLATRDDLDLVCDIYCLIGLLTDSGAKVNNLLCQKAQDCWNEVLEYKKLHSL